MTLFRAISFFVLSAFLVNTTFPGYVWAQEITLPKPGTMIASSPSFNLPVLTGIKVYPDNPFKFDFILDTGDDVPLRGTKRRSIYEKVASVKNFRTRKTD